MRFRMAGIPADRFVCVPDEQDLVKHVTFDGIDRIYVLHECDAVTMGRRCKQAIKQKLLKDRRR